MALLIKNLKRKHVKNTTWPKEKKLQAVAQYLALGNLKLVSATTEIPYGLIRQWKMQPWWSEFEKEIRNTENLSLDNSLTKIVNKSLEAVADRLENGEVIWDSKKGEVIRRPVAMKDAAKVSVDLLTKRELLRGNATNRTEAVAIPVAEQLKLLAAEFARMTSGKPVEVIDVEMVEILNGDVENALEEGDEESSWEDSLLDTESGGATSVHEGSESESLSEEGRDTSVDSQPNS